MNNKRIDKDRKKRYRRKKRHTFRNVIILLLLLAIIVAGGWFAYKTHQNGGGVSGMLATAVGHNENTKKNLKEIKVLLMGVSTDLDSQLTDTIIVASYNPNTQKANLLSIPRDTYTGKYPSTATASKKINALYNITREPEKTLEAVNELTGLDIKYYVLVRTEALIELVDAIGGVEFNVPIDMYYTDKTQNLVIDLDQGTQVLNGNKAEQLIRFRHNNDGSSYPIEYGDNDFGRMRTQRDFIIATLKQTLKPSNIFKLGQILDIAHKNLETNLELSFVKDYLPYAVEFSTEDMKTATLPGTTPNLNETNGVSVFVMNKKEAKELIESMFYEEKVAEVLEGNTILNETIETSATTSKDITIQLLNGSGDTSKLEKAKQILEDAGYTVKKTGKTSAISKTIITNKKDATDQDLKSLKNLLGVGSTSTNKASYSTVDVSIIIGKDFE